MEKSTKEKGGGRQTASLMRKSLGPFSRGDNLGRRFVRHEKCGQYKRVAKSRKNWNTRVIKTIS